MASEDATHFTRVDQTADPGFFIHFLDEANKLPGALAWKPTILDGLRLQPGSRVLDLGCGAGDDAFDLAGRVSPGGDVIGVDVSATLINEATRRAVGRDLAVTFEVGDAQSLRFSDGTFDAVRTERMLMHVPDPKQAFSEMARVLRPGGRIAVADLDWGTQFCDSPYRDTTHKIALSFCDGIKNGWIGRCLSRLLREIGMTDVSVSFSTLTVTYDFLQLLLGGHIVHAVSAGVLSEHEANLWWTHLAQANDRGIFLYGVTGFVACGIKPM